MRTCLLASFALLGYYNSSIAVGVHGFQQTSRIIPAPLLSVHSDSRARGIGLFSAIDGSDDAAAADDDDYDDDDLIAAASKKLAWEISEETSRKPLLNLSSRDASLEETRINDDDDVDDDDTRSDWNRGQRWTVTLEGEMLVALVIIKTLLLCEELN